MYLHRLELKMLINFVVTEQLSLFNHSVVTEQPNTFGVKLLCHSGHFEGGLISLLVSQQANYMLGRVA